MEEEENLPKKKKPKKPNIIVRAYRYFVNRQRSFERFANDKTRCNDTLCKNHGTPRFQGYKRTKTMSIIHSGGGT